MAFCHFFVLQILFIWWVAAVPRPSAATITAPPSRFGQETADFVGYYFSSGKWRTASCDHGDVWSTSGQYGMCVPSTSRNFDGWQTSCKGSRTVMYSDTWGVCTGKATCGTDLIYKTRGDTKPILNIGCATGPPIEIYATISTSSFPQASATPNSTAWTSPAPSCTKTASPTLPPASASTLPPSSSTGNGSGKAWIAGPVVGSVAVVGIAGLLMWIFLLRRHKKKSPQPPESPQQSIPAQAYIAYNPNRLSAPPPHFSSSSNIPESLQLTTSPTHTRQLSGSYAVKPGEAKIVQVTPPRNSSSERPALQPQRRSKETQ